MNKSLFTSNSNEWYTPPHIIELVKKILYPCPIFDPCSCREANETVGAACYLSKEDNGLKKPWHGSVFMNPPYGRGEDGCKPWVEKLVKSYEARDIREAIALVPARTDTGWFQPLFEYHICFVKGRLKFSNAASSAPFPSAVVYMGDNPEGFDLHFRGIGNVVRRY
jgi:phage N-6-adenine-methyltransferase